MCGSIRISAVYSVCATFTLFLAACGVPPPQPTPPTVISDDPEPDTEGRILLPSGYEGLQAGSGLITGNGTHLYKIEGVQVMPDGSVWATTSQGSLAQLGAAGKFRFVDPPHGTPAEKRGPRLAGPDVNLQILDVSMPFSTTVNLVGSGSVTATVNGIFELKGVFHLDFDVGLFAGLRSFSSYIGGDALLDVDTSVEARRGASVSWEEPATGPFRTYYHGVIGAPPYYILVEVTSQLFIGFEGSVEEGASLETGVYASAGVKTGASYHPSQVVGRRWSTITAADFDWGYDEPVVCFDGSESLRAYLRPHFEVQLYSVVGPTFDIEPYGRLDASVHGCLGDPGAEYDVTLTAGAVGYAKIKADILDLFVVESPRLTVFDISTRLGHWENAPPQECSPGCSDDEIGDGRCDSACNNAACNYDAGDCDEPECSPGCSDDEIGDGHCDSACNNAACNYDGGDCDEPECSPGCSDDEIGDGHCDSACNNAACNFDAGDCNGTETLTLDLGGGVTMELVPIPAGSFMMGSDSGQRDESPAHQVIISQDFYIGRYEVTQAQWEAVMGTSPWVGESFVLEQGDCPATYVTWDEAVQFCQTLSASTGYDMRLPSEAEWEYATRAGTTTEYSFGDDTGSLGSYAWYDENAGDVGERYAHPVGQKLPNPWGLYDMHGNVLEWCNDWYDRNYYDISPSTDPAGPSSGSFRIFRSGAWITDGIFLRSADRAFTWPGLRYFGLGFRVAANP